MPDNGGGYERLAALERTLTHRGRDLALFLAFDRPERANDRPGLARTYFAQRCLSDAQLARLVDAFRAIGSYVELFGGELELLKGLAEGRLQEMRKPLKVIYNGIEGGIGAHGFEPGRKALIPAVADAYGLASCNSNAYACALGRHKFHYFTVMRALGLNAPRTWHYLLSAGWAAGEAPPRETKVIVKSTYESWSVGVTNESIFVVDDTCDERVAAIANEIGQSVTVQEFVAGPEVCVPVFSCPEVTVTPPIEAILAKAPGDGQAVTTIDDNLHQGAVERRRYEGPPETLTQLYESATLAFNILELQAFGRIDFRIDSDGRPWVTDVGVSPGLSVDNSAFVSVAELGFDHAEFLRLVIAATLGSRDLLTSSPARIRSLEA